jgi:hypothetical protein
MIRIRSTKRVLVADCFAGLCAAAIGAAVVVLCVRTSERTAAVLSQERAMKVASDIARAERILRLQAVREFPGDHWSQGDAYSFREFRRVTAAATQEKVAIGSVLNALDEYLRKNPNKNNQNRVPLCKPRSFYD